MIKGGGGALTREKIVAAVAHRFVCIADASKLVGVLGKFPLPVEVIPMARSYVARELVKLGGFPAWRMGFTTDNGNVILDVSGLSIVDPAGLEERINGIAGVVTVGLFARRGADVILLGGDEGVRTLVPGALETPHPSPLPARGEREIRPSPPTLSPCGGEGGNSGALQFAG